MRTVTTRKCAIIIAGTVQETGISPVSQNLYVMERKRLKLSKLRNTNGSPTHD